MNLSDVNAEDKHLRHNLRLLTPVASLGPYNIAGTGWQVPTAMSTTFDLVETSHVLAVCSLQFWATAPGAGNLSWTLRATLNGSAPATHPQTGEHQYCPAAGNWGCGLVYVGFWLDQAAGSFTLAMSVAESLQAAWVRQIYSMVLVPLLVKA